MDENIQATQVDSILTKEHKDYINKQITKALKSIDWEEYVVDYIDSLFEQSSNDPATLDGFSMMMLKVIGDMLIKKGLLKPFDVEPADDTEDIEDEESISD